MELSIKNTLVVDKDDDYIEFEVGDHATVWLKDGCCMAIDIQGFNDNKIMAIDEENKDIIISFDEIKDIEFD